MRRNKKRDETRNHQGAISINARQKTAPTQAKARKDERGGDKTRKEEKKRKKKKKKSSNEILYTLERP